MSEYLNELTARGLHLWREAMAIWLSGGWAMVAIAVIAVIMFSIGFNVFFRLQTKGFQAVPERTWRRWIHNPLERRGKIGALLDGATGAESLQQATSYFDELGTTETVPFERDLLVMKICVGATPLVGLLGTVTGMLNTFGALASGSGGEKTMSMVASGISEALITTETGLVIALPGLFFQYILSRKHERYRVFLVHLESVCSQMLYRKNQKADMASIAREARKTVIRRLLSGSCSTAGPTDPPTTSVPESQTQALHPQI